MMPGGVRKRTTSPSEEEVDLLSTDQQQELVAELVREDERTTRATVAAFTFLGCFTCATFLYFAFEPQEFKNHEELAYAHLGWSADAFHHGLFIANLSVALSCLVSGCLMALLTKLYSPGFSLSGQGPDGEGAPELPEGTSKWVRVLFAFYFPLGRWLPYLLSAVNIFVHGSLAFAHFDREELVVLGDILIGALPIVFHLLVKYCAKTLGSTQGELEDLKGKMYNFTVV